MAETEVKRKVNIKSVTQNIYVDGATLLSLWRRPSVWWRSRLTRHWVSARIVHLSSFCAISRHTKKICLRGNSPQKNPTKTNILVSFESQVYLGGIQVEWLLNDHISTNNNNYQTSIAPIYSKRIELSGAPSTGVGQINNLGTMQSS